MGKGCAERSTPGRWRAKKEMERLIFLLILWRKICNPDGFWDNPEVREYAKL
jgi:hypothetical protein